MSTDSAGHIDEGTLAVYVLGGLGRAEAAVHERHLLGCDPCQEQLVVLCEVLRKLSSVPASLVFEDAALVGDVAKAPAFKLGRGGHVQDPAA